jgi:hypothetical protein
MEKSDPRARIMTPGMKIQSLTKKGVVHTYMCMFTYIGRLFFVSVTPSRIDTGPMHACRTTVNVVCKRAVHAFHI